MSQIIVDGRYQVNNLSDNYLPSRVEENVRKLGVSVLDSQLLKETIIKNFGGVFYSQLASGLLSPGKAGGIDNKKTENLVKLAKNLQSPDDIKQLEHAAGVASLLSHVQMNLIRLYNKESINSQKVSDSQTLYVMSDNGKPRVFEALEGGTDITEAARSSPLYSNIMGDQKLLDLMNKLSIMLLQLEFLSNKDRATASIRMFNSAKFTGEKIIASAQENLTGQITSGTFGLALNAGITYKTVSSLNKTIKSANTNLQVACEKELALKNDINSINKSSDLLASEGKPVSESVKQSMAASHPQQSYEISSLRNKDDIIRTKSMKTQAKTQMVRQITESTQNTINGVYQVEAARQNSEAEKSRANQTINADIANSYKEKAEKASQAGSWFNQLYQDIRNTVNNVISSIAGT